MALNLAQAKSALAELTKGHYTTDDLIAVRLSDAI